MAMTIAYRIDHVLALTPSVIICCQGLVPSIAYRWLSCIFQFELIFLDKEKIRETLARLTPNPSLDRKQEYYKSIVVGRAVYGMHDARQRDRPPS